MRNIISLTLCFAIILLSVPALALLYKDRLTNGTETTASGQTLNTEQTDKAASESEEEKQEDSVKVLLHRQNKIITVSTSFYLISVLAKEIDIHSPEQALKAQAVCIATYLKRAREQAADKEYDITDNPETDQSFLSEKELKKFWGKQYDTYYKQLKKIVKSVQGQYLSYGGETVLAAYHSSNAGMTESAENYWGQAYPYLIAVPSPGDTLGSAYQNEIRLSAKQLRKKISAIKNKDFSFAKSPSDWIGDIEFTPSGTVKTLEIGRVQLSGREIRNALGLPSCFFTLSYKNESFVFCVSGYGHGVGLSQEGAKYMAQLGFSYREILQHYYKGVEIRS